jgi:hypothetical protein
MGTSMLDVNPPSKFSTADRLAQHGLPHPERCPLCDQAEESIDHLLVSCVFSRQFWFHMLHQIGLHMLAPQLNEHSFDSWWERTNMAASGLLKQGINSLIILGSWTIWNLPTLTCLGLKGLVVVVVLVVVVAAVVDDMEPPKPVCL